ncbi:trypsin-like peptidase domain-containing protein [Rhizobium johnstonii]|uniref:Protease n=1 Tax=Rhizobium johnstonii (strain DSM 114642 / LMG 32736 / 3841) TaxID=216596 RepID=Q1MI39_RHIJ3|nr:MULTISPECIES: trypsin-like peptidase domain-containing protein [Rhizobium]MBB4507348.1 serine protease Do/serine protease DegQ [Rhizobium leguminosarum]MBY5324465.1 PDZ domain-containing protein [Rhizobium leguminosarum]MBY5343848.1 PDZ domain-containing protein [Rhizobium leguminosarum]MBY5378109.1 PDZ domain-containing protein [Rhizobium leguminosarum]MBY5385745.1 PDZ domain-containing protein [Rhizobium leguminosarum]
MSRSLLALVALFIAGESLLSAPAVANSLSLAPMLQRVVPSVVSISVQGKELDDADATLADPFYRKFFGLPDDAAPAEHGFQSAGSGVVIDEVHGYIVTNQHVIASASKIEVVLSDGRRFKAKLVGADPETDVAVVQIPPDHLVQADFGSASSLHVGDVVVAIGNPFGLGQTATMGIVSALGRRAVGSEGYEGFIQTDASTNPGNSGGALVNENGVVVGINSAIIGPAGGSIGIGFAVPAETVGIVMRQLILTGKMVRGEVGVVTQDLTPGLARAFGVNEGPGALISEVRPGSPAANAGIQPGDVIRMVDGRTVRGASDVRRLVGSLPLQSRPSFQIDRASRRIEAFPAVSAAPVAEPAAPRTIHIARGPLADVEMANSPDGLGARVVVVAEGSVAAQAGLQLDDVIVALDQQPVTDVGQVLAILMKEHARALVTVVRNGHRLFVAADVQTQ